MLAVTPGFEHGWLENFGIGDVDSDGLDARDEVCYVGSDLDVADTDGGGVVDGVELQVGRDPLNPFDDGDIDGDGFPTPIDCDDLDQDVYPGGSERCGTGVDEDCDDLVDEDCPTLSAPVPGLAGVDNTFTVGGAAEGSTVRLVFGTTAGSTPIPGCPGLVVDMVDPRPIASAVVQPGGDAALIAPIPPGASGRTARFQAADLALCQVTNVVVHSFP